MRLICMEKEAPINPYMEKSLNPNGFKGWSIRDAVPESLVRMRSPVQIWLAAPKKQSTQTGRLFFLFVMARFEHSNAGVRWTPARDGSTERNHNFLPNGKKMQTNLAGSYLCKQICWQLFVQTNPFCPSRQETDCQTGLRTGLAMTEDFENALL